MGGVLSPGNSGGRRPSGGAFTECRDALLFGRPRRSESRATPRFPRSQTAGIAPECGRLSGEEAAHHVCREATQLASRSSGFPRTSHAGKSRSRSGSEGSRAGTEQSSGTRTARRGRLSSPTRGKSRSWTARRGTASRCYHVLRADPGPIGDKLPIQRADFSGRQRFGQKESPEEKTGREKAAAAVHAVTAGHGRRRRPQHVGQLSAAAYLRLLPFRGTRRAPRSLTSGREPRPGSGGRHSRTPPSPTGTCRPCVKWFVAQWRTSVALQVTWRVRTSADGLYDRRARREREERSRRAQGWPRTLPPVWLLLLGRPSAASNPRLVGEGPWAHSYKRSVARWPLADPGRHENGADPVPASPRSPSPLHRARTPMESEATRRCPSASGFPPNTADGLATGPRVRKTTPELFQRGARWKLRHPLQSRSLARYSSPMSEPASPIPAPAEADATC